MIKDIRKKVAVITGGGSSIGRALCLALASQGAHAVIADINEQVATETLTLLTCNRNSGMTAMLDVGNAESWCALRDQVYSVWGHCHILCNNAGLFRVSTFEESALDDWYQISRVNIDGVILGCKTFAPDMAKQGEGWIINTASMAGIVGKPGMAYYAASKFAVVGFSQSLRKELAGTGVDVSVLCPAVVDTPMNFGIDIGAERMIPPSEVAQRVLDAVKDGRQFIFTHPEKYSVIKEQMEIMLADYAAIQ